jgi:D-alanyl-lipoteichoic acid acyltransferase DltB (MBOAT superfamily)
MRLNWIYEGGFLIAWGLFQKMFVADNLARIVDPLFASYGPYRGGVVLLSLYIFTFQIYCDFAGYSNIARGLGKLMGFDIMVNFNLPLFATDPQDFWSRWHISLTTWIRDYVYTPLFMLLRFLRGNIRLCAAIVLSMLIFGLWHGAAWHFVFFGLYWGVILSAYSLLRLLPVRPTAGSNGFARALWFAARVLFMFNLVSVGMLFFRAQSMAQAGEMLRAIVFNFLPLRASGIKLILAQAVFFIWFLTAIEALQFFKKGQFAVFRLRPALQFGVYLLIIYSLLLFGVTSNERFIYFQF